MSALRKYSIAYKGLKAGRHGFDFEVGDGFFKEFGGSDILGGAAEVKIGMLKQENMLELDFSITGEVRVECDRCLEEVAIPVDERSKLIVRFSETEQESDGEIMWIGPSESELELGQYIYETIYLGLPYIRVHPDDKNGGSTCDKDMLSRLTIVSAEEFDRMTDPAGGLSPWGKLAELKDKTETEQAAVREADVAPDE